MEFLKFALQRKYLARYARCGVGGFDRGYRLLMILISPRLGPVNQQRCRVLNRDSVPDEITGSVEQAVVPAGAIAVDTEQEFLRRTAEPGQVHDRIFRPRLFQVNHTHGLGYRDRSMR